MIEFILAFLLSLFVTPFSNSEKSHLIMYVYNPRIHVKYFRIANLYLCEKQIY